MFYTIYKTTNLVNGKIYIGSHKTKDLDDGYLGSGKYLWHAINKHGIENFKKEILFVFDNPEEMYAKEAELVNEDFLAEENTYNLKVGGFGGFDYINKNGLSPGPNTFRTMGPELRVRARNKLRELNKNDQFKKQTADKISKTKKALKYRPFLGKKHSAETRQKMSDSSPAKKEGYKNSQQGSKWIHHELFGARKCPFDLVDDYISQGWVIGRKSIYE